MNNTLVNTIFGATKIRGVLGVFEGADFENAVHFSVSNRFCSQSSSHSKSHHLVEQNAMGQIGQQMFVNTAKKFLDKYNIEA